MEHETHTAARTPPGEMAAWKQLMGVAKSHGLNCLRFHSWCPPEAAFVAADELGMYLQVEVAAWTEVGLGKPIDQWLYAETDRILQAYGNHPSFVLMAYGNEPSGKDREYLAGWVAHYRQQDPRRLYTSAAGWPQIEQNQFHVAPNRGSRRGAGGCRAGLRAGQGDRRRSRHDVAHRMVAAADRAASRDRAGVSLS